MHRWHDLVGAATAAVSRPDATGFGVGERLGTAVLAGPDWLLTCRHVVTVDGQPDGDLLTRVAVTFPGRRPVAAIPSFGGAAGVDATVLRLAPDADSDSPMSLPKPVPLSGSARLPAKVELLGYPKADRTHHGVWRSFVVHARVGGAYVQIDWRNDVGSLRGHSGGPVVDAANGRLVGLLHEGSTGGRFDRYLPVTLLSERGVIPRLPWLMEGEDALNHFERHRIAQSGRTPNTEDLFRGRLAACEAIRRWVSNETAPGQVLVVTGQPGAGKSTVIARAGHEVAADSNRWERGLMFHARGATAAHFRAAVADLTGATDDTTDAALLNSADVIAEASSRPLRWVLIVDGLDEASSRADRKQIAALLCDLARRGWVRAAVATRWLAPDRYSANSLLRSFGIEGPDASNLVDLDSSSYFDPADVATFAAALLEKRGEKHRGPSGGAWERYKDDLGLRDRLADRIGVRAGRNFLVAALTSARLAESTTVVDPDSSGFELTKLPASVGDALDSHLGDGPDGHHLRGVLTALAYAHGAGIDHAIWRLMSRALGYPVAQAELDALQGTAIADYLLQTTTEDGYTAIRLFHQALVDQFLEHRNEREDGRAILDEFILDVGSRGGWGNPIHTF